MAETAKAAQDDVWVHSVCDMCFTFCGIKVHRVNGVVQKIEGDPECPHNWGKLCGKGQSGLMGLYDPSRIKTPMKRTNPQKGIGVDPGWVPISWEEALETAAKILGDVRKDDPRKLTITTFDPPAHATIVPAWSAAYGTPNGHWSGYFCGNYLHSSMYLTNGTFHSDFDVEHCKYVILLGNQAGFMMGLNPNIMTQKMADARVKGLKVVSVDPVCSHAGAKANEWVPIRPGTDAALILAMVNVLLNDLNIYDAEFIQRYTNGPYLVSADGLYVRDAAGKPQVWNNQGQQACCHDQGATDLALAGNFTVDGTACQPAFQRLKEHVRQFTPEWASQITTIPAATIRRLAREFGEAAQIGSTITIKGKTMPYRPVAVNIYRGAGAHKHGVHVALSMQILNMIVGAFYRPGGHRGINLVGPDGRWGPSEADGLVVPPERIGHGVNYYRWRVKRPETMGANELYPISTNRSPMYQISTLNPDRIKLPYQPEVLIICRRNHFMANVNHDVTAETLNRFKHVIFMGTHLDEMSYFADLVFPDAHYLEKLELFPNGFHAAVSPATGHYYWGVRQPVVEPPPGVRPWTDILLELAERIGFLGDVYRVLNARFHLKEPYQLDPKKKYTREEIFDRWAKSTLGQEKGLGWMQGHGYHKQERTADELYPIDLAQVRFPIYFENILRAGRDVEAMTRELEIEWDTSDYMPLPVWKPCPAFREQPGNELYAVSFRLPTHFQSITAQNPWLQEFAQHNPYAQKMLVNTVTAQALGIHDGDTIEVESSVARVEGVARVTELIHPEVIGMAGHFGAWAKGKPVARGKGANFSHLLPMDIEHMDWVSSGVDACVRVKVRKAGAAAKR